MKKPSTSTGLLLTTRLLLGLLAVSFSVFGLFAPQARATSTTYSTTQTVSTVIDDVGGPNSVIKTGSTTTLTLSGNNTFTGGLFIKEGTVKGGTTSGFGAGTVYLGDTAGSSNSTLMTGIATSGLVHANSITVQGGNAGVAAITMSNLGSGNCGFSGAITLSNHDLTVNSISAYIFTLSGGVTGTGNLTLNKSGGGNTITISTAPVNNVGTITNISTVASTVISGGVGANVTAINQNGTTGLTLNTNALTVNSAGTALNSGNTGALTVSGGVVGTGNLVLNANSTGTITLDTSAVNNVGTITNNGSGTGTVTIGAVIGTNVTGLSQNSATSTLSLTGANTYAGVITFGTGTISVGTVGNGGVAGNLGAASAAATNLVFDGGTLAVTGNSTSDRAFTINAGKTAIINIVGAGAQSFTGATGTPTNGALVKIGTGTLTLTGSNTFTGGLTIKAGTMIGSTSASAFGNGNITLGDTSGNSNATLSTSATSGLIYTNAITVAGGNTGVATIGSSSQGGFSGAITLSNHDLSVAPGTAYGLTLSGGITGTGNLTINSTTNGGGFVSFTTAPVDIVGTITHISTTGLGGVISGGVGSNVTAINQNSSIALTINTTALTVNSAGTTLNSGSTGTFTVSSGINGTGNLIVNANTTGTISLAAINNAGTVTNSGAGTGPVIVNGAIGANVTAVNQNSTTSTLKVVIGGSVNGATHLNVGTGATVENSNGLSITSGMTLSEGAALFTSAANSAFAPVSLTLAGNLSDGWTAISLTSSAGNGLTKAGGALTLTLSGLTAGNYNLTTGAAFSGTFGTANVNGHSLSTSDGGLTFVGTDGAFNYTYTNSTNTLALVAIPEPTTWAMMVSGLGMLFFTQRIRRRSRS